MLHSPHNAHPPTARPFKRSRALLTAVLAALLSVGGTSAVATAAEPGTATISGTITDITTGEPIAGAAVRDPDSTDSTFSSDDGTYTLVVAPGEHRVSVAASGYQPKSYVDTSAATPTDVLTLADGQDLSDINVALSAYATASGAVTSADGNEPVSGVTVKLFPSDDPTAQATATTQTDSTGLWTVGEVPAGAYVIQFDASETVYLSRWWENAPNRDEATVVDFAPGQSRTALNMALVRGATISGHLQDEQGDPIPDAFVSAVDEYRGMLGNYATTDAEGNFTIRGVIAGQYTLTFQTQDYVAWSYGMTNTGDKPVYFSVPEGADITGKTMTLPKGATLSGRITTSSGSADNLAVWAMSDSGSAGMATDADGNYAIRGLDTGSYRLEFYGNGQQTEYWQDSATWEAATLLDVVRGQTYSGLDAELAPASDPAPLDAKVVGRVVDTSGTGIEGAWIQLDCQERGWFTVSSAADGSFSVAVRAGECEATVSHPGGLFMKTVWRSPEGSTTFSVSTGDSFDLGLVELREGVRLSGRVTGGSDGTLPLAGVSVIAVPADAPAWQNWGEHQTETGEDGTFVLGGLEPDIYTLHYVAPASSGYGERWWSDAISRSMADLVVMPAGTTRDGMDMRLDKVGSISGTVSKGEGGPLPGVRVEATRADGQGVAAVTSDPDGNFTIGGLPAGTYTLHYDAVAAGYESAWWSSTDTAGAPDGAAATPIQLDAGAALSGRNVTLRRAASISGTVVSPEGGGVENVWVSVLGKDGTTSYYALTDAAGSYAITGVTPGSYVVGFEPGQSGFVSEYWDNAPTPELATPLEVGVGQAVTASASLERGGRITGVITTPPGGPAPAWSYVYLSRAAEPELVVAEAEPQPDGTWTAEGLPAGSYLARAVSDSYAPSWWADGHAARTAAGAVAIDVALGATRSGVDIQLLPGAEISGTVTDTDGRGLEAWVSVYDLDRRGNVGSASADVAGAFHVRGLPAGRYALRAQADGHEVRWFTNAEVWVDSTPIVLGDTDARTANMSLPPWTGPSGETSLSGQVTLPEGATTTFDQLTVSISGLDTQADTFVNSSGLFEFRGMPPGTYELTVNDMAGQLAPVRVSVDLPRAELLTVSPVIGGRVTGSVVNEAGKPIEAEVHVVDAYGIEHVSYGLDPYLVSGLPTGPARVKIDAPYPYVDTWVGGSSVPDSGVPVDVTAGETVKLPTTVAVLGGSVSGTVEWPPTSEAWEVVVEAVNSEGQVVAMTGAWQGSPYQLDGLPPGEVKIRFSGQGLQTQWWQNAETEATATPVTVTAGRTSADVDATMSLQPTSPPGTASIAGTVTVLGEPFGGAFVSMVDASGAYAGSATTDSLGRYQLAEVKEGSYRLRFDACLDSGGGGGRITPQGGGDGGACATTWWPGVTEAEASPVEVLDGASLTGFDVSFVASALPPLDPAPVPMISGLAQVGQVLTADAGTWGPGGASLAYQWLRAGAPISGATGSTYTVAPEDVGGPLAVSVTGSLDGYATTTRTSTPTSDVTPGVLTATPTPTVTGTAQVGQTLTAVAGTWQPEPVVLTYQWLRSGTAIPGATTSTYDVTVDDAGSSLSVEVTGSKPGYLSVTTVSSPTAVVPLSTLSPTPRPTISGTTRVGEVLTAVAGEWGPGDVQLAYQWLRGGQPIAGAVGASYTLAADDAGTRISVQVTGSKPGYESVTQTSANTKSVSLGILSPTPTPVISGSPVVGQTLVAEPGTWGPGEVTLTYQWYWAGKKIAGATSATYELSGADQGKRLVVRVTGTKPGYVSVTMGSERTAVVAPAP